jgi:peptidoglycan hydrolase CwlO-like protein
VSKGYNNFVTSGSDAAIANNVKTFLASLVEDVKKYDLQNQIGTQGEEVKKAQKEYDKLVKKQDDLKKQQESLAKEIEKSKANLNTLQGKLDNLKGQK